MTGRAHGAALVPDPRSPVVILVRPQLGENIGAAARAMGNGGLFHLRLVAPRDGWPNERAWRLCSGAHAILDNATVHDTVADAVADLHRVFATCPRPRHVIKPLLTARGAAAELQAVADRGLRAGILFGPERAGLDNDDMAAADTLVRYPLNPDFMSLNLAQAVMVMGYEWWMAREATPPRELVTNETRVGTKRELDSFLDHLIRELDACGFLRNLPKRPTMVRNIRHIFQRGELTEQELRTLHGIVAELVKGRGRAPVALQPRGEAAGHQPADEGGGGGAGQQQQPARVRAGGDEVHADAEHHAAGEPADGAGGDAEPEDVAARDHARHLCGAARPGKPAVA